MVRRRMLIFSAVLLYGVVGAHAQTDKQIFEWGLSGPQSVSTSLPSCQTFPISVKSLTGHGVPPFYMMAFAVGGTPITTLIGTNASDLAWTVQHPIGTQLLLAVVDSLGNSGGVDTPLYTVIEGATECLPPAIARPPFTITSNVTDTLTTCQPWGLTIHGGTPPYNVTLAALNASDVTNATLGPHDITLTYINRAEPNTQMIASVSDMTGRWATGSPLVRTEGSTNVDCPGLVTSSSSEPITQPGNETHAGISRTKKIGVIVGATAGGLLLICGLGTWAIGRLRRPSDKGLTPSSASIVSPFQTWPSGTVILVPPSSTLLAGKHSRDTMSIPLSSVASSSPVAPPCCGARELPPPYVHP
ncbi:hypothetical protein MSAN_00247500 [Mycena sanguinolenta]|uniref:Uncharacterized protein n=1 Tax=Mycena sanguinolenta TaxID=230812 RepID=A0A8H6ZI52_9AGAR|nr:hypothetical protein MSAN_00247500 [Mycena sanguinolenta]